MVLFEVVSSCVFLSIAVGVFLAGVFEGVGGRGFDISSLLLPPSPEAGRPNQLSSAHRQGPGVDTATAGGPRPPPSYHCLSQAGVHPCVQTYIVLVCRSPRSAETAKDWKILSFNVLPSVKKQKVDATWSGKSQRRGFQGGSEPFSLVRRSSFTNGSDESDKAQITTPMLGRGLCLMSVSVTPRTTWSEVRKCHLVPNRCKCNRQDGKVNLPCHLYLVTEPQ